jgi:hypothetical protein
MAVTIVHWSVARKHAGALVSVFFIISITLIVLAAHSWSTELLNCDMECGETLLSIHAAEQFEAHGIDNGLLENLGTYENPLIYTHNVNIGTLSFVLLQALGVSARFKLLFPLAIYGLGLYYVYLTVLRIGESQLAALITLVVFATTYWGLGAFAVNPLRAWHLLALFATIFHTFGLTQTRSSHDITGLVISALAAFGCGYDYWVICGAVSAFVALANLPSLTRTHLMRTGTTIAAAFVLPFLLRQIQIAVVMGPAYWLQDLIYSVAIKVPYFYLVIKIPSLDEIDAYYHAHHVLRPPAQPGNNAAQMFNTFRHLVTSVTVPRWGWISLATLFVTLIFPLLPNAKKTWLGNFSSRLIVPLTLGAIVGILLFAPFSLHVYFKHEFPLLAFLILTAKGATIYFAARFVLKEENARRAIAGAVIVLLIFDAAMVHWNNTKNGPALNFGWTHVSREHPDEQVALSTYQFPHGLMSVANSYFGIDENRVRYVRHTDIASTKERYFVYQPTDRFVDFDSPQPHCEWTGWLHALVGWKREFQPGKSCIYGFTLPPDAKSQPSIDEFIASAGDRYRVINRDSYGIGYVVLERRAN